MKKIFTALDIGSSSVKVVVSEYFNNKYNVLASTIAKSKGIKYGFIHDNEQAALSIKEALDKVANILGIKMDKVLVTVPTDNAKYTLVSGHLKMTQEENIIDGNDIAKVMQLAIYDEVSENEELVTVLPVNFYVDDKVVSDAKGKVGQKLSVKAIMITVPKKNVYSIISLLESIGVSTVDVTVGGVANYVALKQKGMDTSIGAVIDIGFEKTDCAVLNKGILVNSSIIDKGSKHIDNDIKYIYHIGSKEARRIKETFAVSHKRYSQVNEIIETTNDDGQTIKINQYELAEIITARLTEIFKMIKNELNSLTNKQISYIIVTGAITEMPGFKANAEMILGTNVIIANMDKIGIRNNAFSKAYGTIKMFNEKLLLRDKDYSMFDEVDEEVIISTKKSVGGFANDSVIGKVVGYFLDN